MSYLGKTFTLEKQEKFDEFLASLGVPKDRIDDINSKKPSETLVKNGDTYTLTSKTSQEDHSISFTPGVEFDETIAGRQTKTTFVVDGDTFTQTQKYSDGKTLTFKKVYSGDKLVVTATNSAWDGVAVRYYSA